MRPAKSLICLALAAVGLVGASVAAAPAIAPAWDLEAAFSVDLPPGFKDLSGNFTFPFEGGSATLKLGYDDRGRLVGSGVANVPDGSGGSIATLYDVIGTFSVDGSGVTQVHFVENVKNPAFTFDGAVAANALTIAGTYQRKDGFVGLAGQGSGSITMTRTTADPVNAKFVLAFATRMDAKGKLRGGLSQDGKSETTAEITLYDKRPDPTTGILLPRKLTGGKIKGLVKTDKFGLTTATVSIVGPKWTATLAGPVEQTGFHATCDFVGAGFAVHGATATLPVRAGTSPTPTTAVPPYLATGAIATVAAGAVTITLSPVPKKVFAGATSLTLSFPQPAGGTTFPAFVDARGVNGPTFVADGATTYSSALAGGAVTLDVRSYAGGKIEVLATGTVAAGSGKKKTLYALIDATVQ